MPHNELAQNPRMQQKAEDEYLGDEADKKTGKANWKKRRKKVNAGRKKGVKKDVATIYTCPMHPEVTSDKPGKCPKCGMDLVKKK